MADIYTSALAGGGGVGSEVDPFTLVEAVAYIEAGTLVNGETCWVKADGTYTTAGITITASGSTTNVKSIAGYSSVIGDKGQATIQRSGGTLRMWHGLGSQWSFRNFIIDGQNSGSENLYWRSDYVLVENVLSINAGSIGIRACTCYGCISRDNGSQGFYQCYSFYCMSYDNNSHGFFQTLSSHCISADNAGYGFSCSNGTILQHCTADNNTDHGVLMSYNNRLVNVIITNVPVGKHGIYFNGINANNFFESIVFYGNDSNSDAIDKVNSYQITDPSYNDAGNNDYRVTNTSLYTVITDINGVDYGSSVGVGRLEYSAPTYATASDVRSGTDRGDGTPGTLDLPAVNDVQDGITFDNTTKEGTLSLPTEANVKSGIQYGANDTEFTGSYDEDYPSVNDVEDGVSFGNTVYEGTLKLPAVTDVRLAVGYGANDTEFTGTLDLPALADVEYGVNFDNLTKTGTLVIPNAADVRLNTTYGAASEFTGTMIANTISTPIAVTIETAQLEIGVSVDG